MKVSVVVFVYNRPYHLYKCLEALCLQTVEDFEVLVADSGSGEDVKKVVEEFSKVIPLKHVWIDFVPFGKALVANKAVKESKGDLILFTDADCLPEENWVESYIKGYEDENTFLLGGVYYLDETASQFILENGIGYFRSLKKARDSVDLKRKMDNLKRQLKTKVYSLFGTWRRPKGYGGNIGIPKPLYEKVGGYDEKFTIRGEDTDLVSRMLLSGARYKPLYTKAISYHLAHETIKEDEEFRKLRREILKWSNYKKFYSPGVSILESSGFEERCKELLDKLKGSHGPTYG